MTLPLSILDLAPVPEGTNSSEALRRIVDLARLGDELGYARIWYAEHHGMPSIASSSPEVLIATAAAATSRIHVGSGGVMLPNHVPLRVVETYRTLSGLHPGRIDLGIGRAGGSDGRTLSALRSVDGNYFPQELAELLAFEQGGFPMDHPFAPIRVVPEGVPLPPIYLLGSSGASAAAAGELGALTGPGFDQHLGPETGQLADQLRDHRDAGLTLAGLLDDCDLHAVQLIARFGCHPSIETCVSRMERSRDLSRAGRRTGRR